MKSAPCRDCTKRSATCHPSCKDYLEWDKERKELLAAKYKDCLTNVALNDIKFGKRQS